VFENRNVNNIRLMADRDNRVIITWIDALTSELKLQVAILDDAGASNFKVVGGAPTELQLLNRTVLSPSSESAQMVFMPLSDPAHVLVGSLKDETHTIYDVKASFPNGALEVNEMSSRAISRPHDVSVDPLVDFVALPNNTIFYSHRTADGAISAEIIEIENHTTVSSYVLPIDAQYVVMGSLDYTERLTVALGWLSPQYGFFTSMFPAEPYVERLAYDKDYLWLCNNSGTRAVTFDTHWHVDHTFVDLDIPGNFIGNATRMRRTCADINREKNCESWRTIPIGDFLYDGYMELSFELLADGPVCGAENGCPLVFGTLYSNKSLNGIEDTERVQTNIVDYPLTDRGDGWYSGSPNEDRPVSTTVQAKVRVGDIVTMYS
jgi:hypothetical protein